MAELIINTNEVVINEGNLKKDITKKKELNNDKNTSILNEINRKLDLLLKAKEKKDGETNN